MEGSWPQQDSRDVLTGRPHQIRTRLVLRASQAEVTKNKCRVLGRSSACGRPVSSLQPGTTCGEGGRDHSCALLRLGHPLQPLFQGSGICGDNKMAAPELFRSNPRPANLHTLGVVIHAFHASTHACRIY